MTNLADQIERANADRMHEIEGKHFGRCLAQVWYANRRTLIELLDWPRARCQAVLVKVFERPVPRGGRGTWPDLSATYVYVPLETADNTWDALDKALAEFEATHSGPCDPSEQ